jgi:hypothetical protein
VAFVRGRITYYREEGDAEIKEEETSALVPSLDILPPESRWRGHSSVFVGDARLTEMKRVLQSDGVQADFDRGCLVIGEKREFRVQKV